MKDAFPKLVLVKDDRSRVLSQDAAELGELRRSGWAVVWDEALDDISGWAHAAIHHGALPADYDNPMGARPMAEAIPLFRSVSIPEMADIIERGTVLGGGNSFNGFDRRPFVFFAPELTPRVIHQGEEIDRMAHYALRSDPAHRCLTALPDEERAFYEEVRTMAIAHVASFNAARRRDGRKPMFEDPGHWDDFSNPNSTAFRDALWMLPETAKAEIKTRLAEFTSTRQGLIEELRIVHERRCAEISQEREPMTYSSAVIETVPIGLGLHFSKRFGQAGMGPEDEYGLFPSQVRFEHIMLVHWVKDGVVRDATSMSDAVAVSDQLRREAMGMPASMSIP